MGRSPCCSREGLNKGAWTAVEDEILRDYITLHGEGRWRNLPKRAGLKRCGKSCRLRWLNYLRPDIKRGNISSDEEELIIRLHKLLGNRWSLIAGRLPGRTDNEIKNYWNSNLAKKAHQQIQHTTTTSASTRPHHQQYPHMMGSHQVIRTKAIKCSKVCINPDAETSPSSSPDNHDKPLQSDRTYSSSINHPSDFMVDFNLEDFSLSDFLNSDFSGLCDFTSTILSPASHDHQPDLFSEEMLQDSFLTALNDSDPENVASYLNSIAS